MEHKQGNLQTTLLWGLLFGAVALCVCLLPVALLVSAGYLRPDSMLFAPICLFTGGFIVGRMLRDRQGKGQYLAAAIPSFGLGLLPVLAGIPFGAAFTLWSVIIPLAATLGGLCGAMGSPMKKRRRHGKKA